MSRWLQPLRARATTLAVMVGATLAAAAMPGRAAAPVDSAWPVQDGALPHAAFATAAGAAGWVCTEAAALPGDGRALLVCRATKGGQGGLQLLEATTPAAGTVPRLRVLGGLGDAATAHSRVFSAPQPCAPGQSPCLAAVVLVDHRDEGGCFGTLVYAALADRPLQRLGMVSEVLRTPGAVSETCVAPVASVVSDGSGARIGVQGALWRIGRDGVSRALRQPGVSYRVRTKPLSMMRAG